MLVWNKFLWPYAWGCLVALSVGWTSCGESTNGQSLVSGRQETLVIQIPGQPVGLNPINARGADANYIQSQIFDHLIALDFKTLDLTPVLATDLPDISEDRKRITFTLREDLKFSDGRPLTTRDIEFSFKALKNPRVNSTSRRAELQNFTDLEIIDDRKVAFLLTDAGPLDLNRLAINFFVLPKHVYDPNNFSDAFTSLEASMADKFPDSVTEELEQRLALFADFFETERFQWEKGFVVGSGPYQFDALKSGQFIRLVKNEDYWNQDSPEPYAQQRMDTLIYRIIESSSTALAALRSGEIDFSSRFTPIQFSEEMGGDFERNFSKENVSYPIYEYIGYNARIRNEPQKTFFADVRVRQALSHLVHVDEITQNIMVGTATPIVSLVYEDRPEHNDTLVPIGYDEERARDLLAEAGWIDRDGDGILEKEVMNSPVNFEFNLCYRQGSEVRERIARHVREKLKKMGIVVHIQALDWPVMLDRLGKHEIDAWVGGWAYDSDEQDLFSLFHSSQMLNSGYNWGSYSSPEADSVMEAIVLEWDREKRFHLHRKIQEILYRDQPYTLLFANSARIAYNKRLTPGNWYGQRPCYFPGEFSLAEGIAAK